MMGLSPWLHVRWKYASPSACCVEPVSSARSSPSASAAQPLALTTAQMAPKKREHLPVRCLLKRFDIQTPGCETRHLRVAPPRQPLCQREIQNAGNHPPG